MYIFYTHYQIVFTQSEMKISWQAALQKPGYVNASALVGDLPG